MVVVGDGGGSRRVGWEEERETNGGQSLRLREKKDGVDRYRASRDSRSGTKLASPLLMDQPFDPVTFLGWRENNKSSFTHLSTLAGKLARSALDRVLMGLCSWHGPSIGAGYGCSASNCRNGCASDPNQPRFALQGHCNPRRQSRDQMQPGYGKMAGSWLAKCSYCQCTQRWLRRLDSLWLCAG